jgi:hypothetical protein
VNWHPAFLASHLNKTRQASTESRSLRLVVEAMAEEHHIDFGVGGRATAYCYYFEQTLSVVVVEADPIE